MTLVAPLIEKKSKQIRFFNLRSAVIKLTSRCNIQCGYCYENITFGKQKHHTMTPEVFKNFVDIALHSTRQKKFLFILHGGEPTLLSEEWFYDCVGYAYRVAEEVGVALEVSIQTNLINVTHSKFECFKALNISIGASLDNPAHVHSAMRPLAHKVIEHFNLARDMGIQCGILT